jgi:predicted nucleic acid-binding protein
VIVVDASAVLELLLRTPAAQAVERRLFGGRERLHAPHLLDVEVAHVLRRYALAGELQGDRGRAALEDLERLLLRRHPHDILLPRAWELRANLTAYDAVYVALAEALDAPLVTRDRRLAGAAGHRARIEYSSDG